MPQGVVSVYLKQFPYVHPMKFGFRGYANSTLIFPLRKDSIMNWLKKGIVLGAVFLSASGAQAGGSILTSIEPSIGPTKGGSRMFLNGRFGREGAVIVDGQQAEILKWEKTKILCVLPPGQGENLEVQVESEGQTTESVAFSYLPPSLGGVDPASGPTQGGTELTLTGKNFGIEGGVVVGGNLCEIISWDHAMIVCATPAGWKVDLPVVVMVGDRASELGREGTTFSYNPPVLGWVNPDLLRSGDVELNIHGANFSTGGRVIVDGEDCEITSWDHADIVCQTSQSAGSVVVKIGKRESNVKTFSTLPTLETVEPSEIPTQGGTELTLSGRYLGHSGSVKVNYVVCEVTSWSNTEIVCIAPPGQGANLPVTVFPDKTESHCTEIIDYAAPLLEELIPDLGPMGGKTELTLNGQNFGTIGTVKIGGEACIITSWSHTQIVCRVPVGNPERPQAGVKVIVSGQESEYLPYLYE